MPPDLALSSTLIGSNYPCLELIFMVPNLFEPLKFDCMYINFDKRKLQYSFQINTPNRHNVAVAHPVPNAGMYGKFSVSGGAVSKRTTDFVCQIHLQHNEELFLYLFVLQGEFKRKLNKKSVVCMG